MPVLADDSLERARFHALLDEARRCRACVGLLPFEPARSFRYRRWRACSRTARVIARSAEHTSELQSLMRISYAVFCLQQKNNNSLQDIYSLDVITHALNIQPLHSTQ